VDDETLDGNAIGGLLAEVFGADMTMAARARHRGPLPLVRQRADGVRLAARDHLHGPDGPGQPELMREP
jgi:hypothetical protein